MMIQQNISAPCTVLDFPTRESFQEELAAGNYDIVGISSIVINVGKVQQMCGIVSRVAPNAVIVVGGHVTALPDIEVMVDADHFVCGDGIPRDDSKRWLDWAFRRDFDRNGPSLFRVCRTTLEGWRRQKDHPDERIRQRFNWEVRWLHTASYSMLWAMQRRLKNTNPVVSAVINSASGYWLRVRSAQSPGQRNAGPLPALDRAP